MSGKKHNEKVTGVSEFNQIIGSYKEEQHVGNKAKGRISKRVFQENKARQIFRKKEHF